MPIPDLHQNLLPDSVPKPGALGLLTLDLPQVCEGKRLLLTCGFHRFCQPELLFAIEPKDMESVTLFKDMAMRFMNTMLGDEDEIQSTRRTFAQPDFWTIQFRRSHEDVRAGKSAFQRAAIRKLSQDEERLLLAEFYSEAQDHEFLSCDDVLGIPTYGVCLVELADEKQNTINQPGFNWNKATNIKTVRLQ